MSEPLEIAEAIKTCRALSQLFRVFEQAERALTFAASQERTLARLHADLEAAQRERATVLESRAEALEQLTRLREAIRVEGEAQETARATLTEQITQLEREHQHLVERTQHRADEALAAIQQAHEQRVGKLVAEQMALEQAVTDLAGEKATLKTTVMDLEARVAKLQAVLDTARR